MLISSSSTFNTCIEGLKSALPNVPKYDKYRTELNAITPTPEGKHKLIVIVNSVSLSIFERLQKNCASLPWPDTFKNLFDVHPIIEYFYSAPSTERSNENFKWLFDNFLVQKKYERAFLLLSQAPRTALYTDCLSSLKSHIGIKKNVVKNNVKGVISAAHTLTQAACKLNLIKMIFERLLLLNESQEELVLKLQSSDDRSKMLFLLSIYYFQLFPGARQIAEKYQQLMPEETFQQSSRKERLGDYYTATHAWTPNTESDLFETLSLMDRFMISTDGELY